MKTRVVWTATLLLAGCAVFQSNKLYAADGPPPITRSPVPVKEEPRLPHPSVGDKELVLTRLEQPVPFGAESAEWATTGRVCIIVNSNIYSGVSNALALYQEDLGIDGFSSFITLYSSGSPEDLRAAFAGYYAETQSLAGLVMIGDIPYALFEETQVFPGWPSEYEEFACDIFYMDLDGDWLDLTNSGTFSTNAYDGRSGNLDLEVWACRMRTDTLSSLGDEVPLITNYLARDHRYRHKEIAWPTNALIYNDDDWVSGSYGDLDDDSNSISRLFGGRNISAIGPAEETSAADFKSNRMTAADGLISVRSHGYATMHGFYTNSYTDFDWVYSSNYRSIDPSNLFYSLYICQAGDYTANNYLGGTAVFNPQGNGVLAWTSTKRGGLWNDLSFYAAMARGECVGEAFRIWFNTTQADFTRKQWMEEYWYGMVLLGDATLSVREPTTRYVALDGSHVYPYTNWAMASTSIIEAIDAALSADTVMVTNGLYETPTTISIRGSAGKHVTLTSVNGASNTTIHGGSPLYTNQCLSVINANAEIDGFTITGGHAQGAYPSAYGGGVYIDGTMAIRDCIIVSNTAAYGGGLYLDGYIAVDNCLIAHNAALTNGGLGGGVYSMGHAYLTNCTISDNYAPKWGGGMACRTGDELANCEIRNNSCEEYGGGLYIMNNEKVWVRESRIIGNSAGQHGGGAHVAMTNWLINTLIAENVAPTGGGLYCLYGPSLINCTVSSNEADVGGGIYSTNCVWVTNCIIAYNSGGNVTNEGDPAAYAYCCVPGGVDGTNNIDADPDFMFAATDPYKPSPISPCVDAGFNLDGITNTMDLRGDARIQNGTIDIGAYESYPPEWDSDADEMPDAFEWRYLRSLTNMVATDDLDTDTVMNVEECIAGTDPTNASSFFCVQNEWNLSGSGCCIEWFGVSNRIYTVWTSTNLPGESWSTCSDGTNMLGQGTLLAYTNAADTANRHFRLTVQKAE